MPKSQTARDVARIERCLARVSQPGVPWKARKEAARRAACLAERVGHLTRPDACEGCGQPAHLERHHPDHHRPLAIQWLCRECHKVEDRRLRKGKK